MEKTIQKKTGLKKKQKDAIFVACLVVLPLIQYAIFYIYVNINSIFLAFESYENGVYYWNNFANFKRFFQEMIREDLLWLCLKNSLIYYVIHTAVGTAASLVFSFYIFKKRACSKLFKVMLFLPSIISAIALTLIYKNFVDYAVPSIFLELFGVTIKPLASAKATTFGTVVFYGVWMGFGTSILMYSGAMANVSDSVIEAAKIDGANEFRQFTSICVPLIYATLTTFLISGVAAIFSSDMNLYAFFGSGAERYTWTFGYYLLKLTRDAGLPEYPYPATIGLLLTVISVPLTFLIRWALQKFGPTVD